jgi:predicted HAD superfamily Cof-like phosphohydrolase
MQCVLQFHEAFGLPVAASPRRAGVPAALAELRIDLLVEEVQEFAEAARGGDLVALADALADIVYVTYGAALTYGIDLDAVLREIHRSNMSKLGPDGRPVLRADGKVLKPVTYRPPNVKAVLAVQLPLPFEDTF